MNKIHRLKTWIEYFQESVNGNKTFEIRKNDRNYKVGDVLILEEYDQYAGEYTSNEHWVQVTYLLTDEMFVKEGYCILSTKPMNRDVSLNEIETSGWYLKVGDVLSNGCIPYHIKITNIVLDKFTKNVNDAWIHFIHVDPNNHDKPFEEGRKAQRARAWYINENWYL